MTAAATIDMIAAHLTHDLRRRVLRNGDPAALVEWDGDDEPATFHIGAMLHGEIVATSTWLARRDSDAPSLRALQLRGMATDPATAGRGLGGLLLAEGLEHARVRGIERVWANARVTAIGFYERAGWTASGPTFETGAIALAHRHVHLDVV